MNLYATKIMTQGGYELDTYQPDGDLMHVDDIAWALSQIPRYCGHTPKFYSVAQHSVLLAYLAIHSGLGREECLWALLHDGHEAFGLADVATPTRNAILVINQDLVLSMMMELFGPMEQPRLDFIRTKILDPFHFWKRRMDQTLAESLNMESDLDALKQVITKIHENLSDQEQVWRENGAGQIGLPPMTCRFWPWSMDQSRAKFMETYNGLMPGGEFSKKGRNWLDEVLLGSYFSK